MSQIKAEYVDHMGSDLTVVNAARVSFNKESSELDPKDTKLIGYLADHNHWTPFSHCMITLRETVPIFVARQRFKHMVGFTYNEVSRRYVDDTPEFYIPEVWRSRPEGSVKQGSGGSVVEKLHRGEGIYYYEEPVPEAYKEVLDISINLYEEMLIHGVAPEMARMVLPQSMMTSYYVTGSLAAFARAYKLRSDDHSQLEIQDLANQWDQVIRPLFPNAWSKLVE